MNYKLPKRLQKPEWHGAFWHVHVVDGNGVDWIAHFPTSANNMGTTKWHDGMTPEIAREIIRALQETINCSPLERITKPRPSGRVVRLHPKDPDDAA